MDADNCVKNGQNNDEKYVSLKNYDDYEILLKEPHTVRRKNNKRVISESVDCGGYIRLNLKNNNGWKKCYKHKIIAEQFIPNPNNLSEIEHIDRNRTNNLINNLRWISHADNCKNRVVKSSGKQDHKNKQPDDIVKILKYNNVEYHDNVYYFCYEDDSVYKKLNGDKWHKLKQTLHNSHLIYQLRDINGNQHAISVNSIIKHFRYNDNNNDNNSDNNSDNSDNDNISDNDNNNC